ncbi:ephrin type-A receptor 8-like [Phalaenopsis equestris]|uniref:ephrin type-A receptor 8-like n=1 Tax=Phalaenopsis equestris TaxID=78828 RepID=UPI0009E2800E|nr:ephrin type-A receptor 8-like [Phalaenopsis equestris]
MSAALECWSGRPSTDEDMVEQVLMKTHHRSEAFPSLTSSTGSASAPSSTPASPTSTSAGSPPSKKWLRLGRNFAGAIAALKNSLNLDSSAPPRSESKLSWAGVVRSLTQLFPTSQLPEKLVADVRRHFDSLPNSYSQAGFDMKDVILHLRLVDQVAADDLPAFQIQQIPGENSGCCEGYFKLSFVCNSSFSWPTMSSALDGVVLCYKKIQIFEKKGLILGVVTAVIHPGGEKQFKSRIDAALRSASRKQRAPGVKLPFSLCGCQEEGSRATDDDSHFAADNSTTTEFLRRTHLPNPLPESSLVVYIDEWQTVRSGRDELDRWLLGADEMEFVERVGASSFTGFFKGKKVWIKKLKGCEKGNAYEIEIRQDLMQLMNCGQKNLLHFCGICIHESNGLCVVTRLMEGGSVHDLIQRNKKVPVREVMMIALDVAEGLMFMNSHGVSYRDLNRQKILLDRQGNACLGDMGVVSSCMFAGEVTEYETAGYRWLAPEIIAGDPESVTETCMSNIYSFGMVLWEMITGEAAFSSYSPVQAAVGIAACGLRPDIPKDCPPVLRYLMTRCWNNCPTKRPKFSEIVAILLKHNVS